MRIVVIEDEIRIREGICKLLGKMFPQHEVVGDAINGQEGLELIVEKKPDLIITDVKMPIMDGLTMLSILSEKKIKYKAIVLSAYAEFSYAQQAIRWGVSEYLIKPLVVNDFVQAIKNMEMHFEENEIHKLAVYDRLDNILLGIILGGIEIDENLKDFAGTKFGIKDDTTFSMIQVYMGKQYDKQLEDTKSKLERFFAMRKSLNYCLLEIPKDKVLLAVLYGPDNQQDVERWFQMGVVSRNSYINLIEINYGWINTIGMKELRDSYHILLQQMDWNVSFGSNIMISYPKVLNVKTSLCIYPIDIENRVKSALCSFQRNKVYDCMEQFTHYFQSGNVYEPKNIKECYVRFIWSMINVGKEISILNHELLEQKKILQKIMSAINKEELKDIMEEIYSCMKENEFEEKNNLSLNVKRAEKIILECYMTGITLEEIATKLNLTPEYLGMQFHLEKGIKFSIFIRDVRITKAKELLIGTNMNIGEVADKVGYADAKYFSKVFRECTGQLPTEYRKTNK